MRFSLCTEPATTYMMYMMIKVIQVRLVGLQIYNLYNVPPWHIVYAREAYTICLFYQTFLFLFFFLGSVVLMCDNVRVHWRKHIKVQTLLYNGHIKQQDKAYVCCDFLYWKPIIQNRQKKKKKNSNFWKWIWDSLLSIFFYFNASQDKSTQLYKSSFDKGVIGVNCVKISSPCYFVVIKVQGL